jgi:hypothetical protein
LVEKELVERQFLDRQRPSFFHCIEVRGDIDDDVESNLQHQENVHRGRLRVGIHDGHRTPSAILPSTAGGLGMSSTESGGINQLST